MSETAQSQMEQDLAAMSWDDDIPLGVIKAAWPMMRLALDALRYVHATPAAFIKKNDQEKTDAMMSILLWREVARARGLDA